MSIYKMTHKMLLLSVKYIKTSLRCVAFRHFNRKCHMAMASESSMDVATIIERAKMFIPDMKEDNHKGEMGRIGIIGGSLEYTGAPYYAGMSALRCGADLVHIFCCNDAATAIKSYSPDLIVHPILDKPNAVNRIKSWLEKLHVVVIGPGLGRDNNVLDVTAEIIKICRTIGKPTIIDADGIYLLTLQMELICGFKNLILTPNAMEFRRLFGEDPNLVNERINVLGNGITIIEKGNIDCVHVSQTNKRILMPEGGSNRRCGGQGDILVGILATFFHWAILSKIEDPAVTSSFCSAFLAKECNFKTYERIGRSMLASDIIDDIHIVFEECFDKF